MACRKEACESNGLMVDSAPLGDIDVKSKLTINLTSGAIDFSSNDVSAYGTTAIF